ncbi:hypothetical protein AVEN_165989-1 [Araneus ventricosus]|uniref:Uncharacterized protein n=1 Tax=Araneus ventricosus TaxID=182803 RepID=A0A4Y2UGX3_ARAVE|nr:hypothetical protein AVEN_165989-1 [Araneus ventricosus]
MDLVNMNHGQMMSMTPQIYPLSKLPHHSSRRTFDLTCNRSTYTVDLQWNLVLNLESSGPEAKTTRPLRPQHSPDINVNTTHYISVVTNAVELSISELCTTGFSKMHYKMSTIVYELPLCHKCLQHGVLF